MNRFIGVGRLTKDVNLKYLESGKAVGNFTIAINRQFKNKQTGETDADFINCVVWDKAAENLAKYMRKGSQIGVDGRLQSRTYKDKEDKTVFITEVVADSVQFLETKSEPNTPKKNELSKKAEPVDINDSELPF